MIYIKKIYITIKYILLFHLTSNTKFQLYSSRLYFHFFYCYIKEPGGCLLLYNEPRCYNE